jgi:peptidoglycan/xylan/chitin deacetylase (PgdA/CDA1 family)
MFHRFREEGAPGAGRGDISPAELEAILVHLGVGRFLDPSEWLLRLDEGRLAPGDLCLTFDDGLKSQLDLALPVLERFGLKAFWFVYSRVLEGGVLLSEVHHRFILTQFEGFETFFSAFLDGCPPGRAERLRSSEYHEWAAGMRATFPFYGDSELQFRFVRNKILTAEELDEVMGTLMSARGTNAGILSRDLWLVEEDLRRLSEAGHEVGLHSHDHPYQLADLQEAEQRRQYETNLDHLARVGCGKIRSASHPLNSYCEATLKILAEIGVRCAFRSNMAPPPGKSLNPGPLELAREDSGTLRRQLFPARERRVLEIRPPS